MSDTLKYRVGTFWDWFEEKSPYFSELMVSGRTAEIGAEMSGVMEKHFPGLAWVFGRELNGHSLTLTGEGNPHYQLVAQYWMAQAPEIPAWTFFSTRQPGSLEGMELNMNGLSFKPMEFWICPTVDVTEERVHLEIWHPKMNVLTEDAKWRATLLFLDEALGELVTGQFVGGITFGTKKLGAAFPLGELPEFMKSTQVENNWELAEPGEAWAGYSSKDPDDRFPRSDIIAGTTSQLSLIAEFGESEGNLEDPLSGLGADYVYLAFPILETDNFTMERSKYEEWLHEALTEEESGFVLGGAHGVKRVYIDLFLTDGVNSIQLVREILAEHPLPMPDCVELHYFAKEKRGHRLIL